MKHTLSEDATVVDFGAHFYPEEIKEHLSFTGGGSHSDEYAGLDRMHDPETRIREMKAAGVDAQVNSITTFMGHDDADVVAETNDALVEYVHEYDEFYGLASLPTAAGGDVAAEEFERCIDNGFNGVALNETHVSLTDEEMEPVYEVAESTGAPVFVHVPSLPYIDLRFNATFGRERALQESIAAVIHRGVYDRHPDVKMVWHHLGGNIAAMIGRIHLHLDEGRWPLQEDLKPFDEFKRQLEEFVYVDTSGFFGYSAPIRIALEEFPSTQILYATDYPGEPRGADELAAFIDAITGSANLNDAERILGANALELMVNV
ncbi:MAG: amidohydrolase family protein, partial [Halobacteriales archaeon]|nr:amidohydrolase family protein [Halobacteriales archaeon]